MIDAPDRPEGLRIRHAEPEDFVGFHASMSSPRAMRETLQVPYTPKEWWRERLAKFDQPGCTLVAEVPSGEQASGYEIVGNASMHPHGPATRRRHAMHVGLSVRDDWQGQGVRAALMEALVARADDWTNVLRLELTVYVDNAAAIALYRRFGFVVEGTHVAYALRDGAFVDAYAMARLHPNQPLLPNRCAAREASTA